MKKSLLKIELIATATLVGILVISGSLIALNSKRDQAKINKTEEARVQAVRTIEGTSVMITNRGQNHGGTGVVLSSTTTESTLLTNRHVCKVIENGGVVLHRTGVYQAVSYIESQRSDLCLINVLADLKGQLVLAPQSPQFYDQATISGHPNLFPNVITEGHVSGKQIIQVLMGMKKCTEADYSGRNALFCGIFGGYPLVENYESTLVTATIMPGSSGSAVYNKDKELIGLVFAGNGGIGYAWTVPYEQVARFLQVESKELKPVVIDQSLGAESKETEESSELLKKATVACTNNTNDGLADLCRILNRDVMWRK